MKDKDDFKHWYNPNKYTYRSYGQQKEDPKNKTAFSAPVANKTAFATPVANKTAFATPVANKTAFATPVANKTAFAAPANKTAFAEPKKNATSFVQSKINPAHPTGLEPAPKDHQYDVPMQLKQPLVLEDMKDRDDFKHWHNANKYSNSYAYSQQKDDAKNKTALAAPVANKTAFAEPKKNATAFVQTKINPAHPTGLEPAPKDHQYDVPM
jgi:hypothetical protein